MDVSKKIVPPNNPFVHRVFHYFHHPFWGKTPYFWVDTHMDVFFVAFFASRVCFGSVVTVVFFRWKFVVQYMGLLSGLAGQIRTTSAEGIHPKWWLKSKGSVPQNGLKSG